MHSIVTSKNENLVPFNLAHPVHVSDAQIVSTAHGDAKLG